MNRIKAKAGQWNSLLADIKTAQKAQPIGAHLNNDEAVGYAMEILSPTETQRVDNHLASCSDCAEEMERLMEASALWDSKEGAKRLANLHDFIRAKMANAQNQPAEKKSLKQLAGQLGRFILPVGRTVPAKMLAKISLSPVDLETDDRKLLRCRMVPDHEGNLTVRLASHELVPGTRLRLVVKRTNWQKDVILRKVASNQVGEKLVIPKEEREKWPEDAKLEIEIPLEDLETSSSD